MFGPETERILANTAKRKGMKELETAAAKTARAKSAAKRFGGIGGMVRRHPVLFGVAGGAAGYGMMKGRSSGANGLTPNSSGGQGVYGM